VDLDSQISVMSELTVCRTPAAAASTPFPEVRMPKLSIINRRLAIGVTACVVAGLGAIGVSPANARAAGSASASAAGAPKATLTYPQLKLPGGQWAAVYSDGIAEVHRGNQATGDQVKLVRLPMAGSDAVTSAASQRLPSRGDIIMDLVHSSGTAYVPNQIV